MSWGDRLKDISHLGTSSLLTNGMKMVDGLVAARILGPEILGIWLMVKLGLRYGQRIHGGIPNGFRRQIAIESGAENDTAFRNYVDSTATFIAIVTLPLLLGFIAVGVWTSYSSHFRLAALFGAAIVTFQMGRSFTEPYFNGQGEFRQVSRFRLIRFVLLFIAIGMTFSFGFLGFLCSRVLLEVGPFLYALSKIEYFPTLRFEFGEIRELFHVGFPIMIVGFAKHFLVSADRVVIIWAFSSEILGFYGAGDTFATLLMTLSTVISSILFTAFSEQVGEGTPVAELKEDLINSVSIFSYLLPLGFVGLFVTIPAVIGIFLPEYQMSIPVAQSMAFGYTFFSIATIAGSMLHSLNRQRIFVLLLGGAVVTNIGLNTIVVSFGGSIIAISLVTAITYAVYAITVIVLAIRICEGTVHEIMRTTGKLMISTVIAGGYAITVTYLFAYPTGPTLWEYIAVTVTRLSALLPIATLYMIMASREIEFSFQDVMRKGRDLARGR